MNDPTCKVAAARGAGNCALPEPFAKPVLIVCGTQDDMTGYRDAWRMMDVFPRATYAVLDGVGHLVNLEHRALFEALADDWLTRMEQFRGHSE